MCSSDLTEEFGMRTPIIGPILNFLVFKVIARKKANWNLVREDMILDNNLFGRYFSSREISETNSD